MTKRNKLIALVCLASLASLLLLQQRTKPSEDGKSIDTRLDISTPELQTRLRDNEDIVMVDVRPEKEFISVHIPDSINIPLHLLKTKGHLKSQTVILISEGYARLELEEECHRLRPLGFTRLAILSGGLAAWQQSGSPLNGDPFAAKKLAIVPPQTFFLERPYRHRLVLDIGSPPADAESNLIPESVRRPDNGGPGFIAEVKKLIAEQDKESLHSVLLFTSNGQGYEALAQRFKIAGLWPIFYLQGGREGYKAFLDSQALLRQPQKLSTGDKTCATCP